MNSFMIAMITVMAQVVGSDVWSLIWAVANSPLGITIISAVVIFLLGKVFTAKPEWEKTFIQYRGLFFDAVRAAEKAIPDTTENKSAAKADAALKYLLKIEPGLSRSPTEDLKRALEETLAIEAAKAKAGA